MNTAINLAAGRLRILASCAFLALLAAPAPLIGQEFPRDELDEALDELATERAQELNQAYYDYEASLEDLRREATREDRPELYAERRQELRTKLEERVLRIERDYEQRRADVLLAHTDRGDRARPLGQDERFGRRADGGRPGVGRNRGDRRIAQLNDDLARAWAAFHREAQEARRRARTDDTWDDYEATLTRLQNEYEQEIADIQRRQRSLRFEMERERRAEADRVGEPDDR
ncbi:MAG TPA: hypothetical protein VLA33_08045 [Gemmatimonadota bacterium]|nr:hypothetical protein [Gemmatimonadota bacterium]